MRRRFKRTCRSLNVFALGTRKRSDARSAHFRSDGANTFKITVRGDCEAGFKNVHAEIGELMRHAQLFVVVHRAAWGLLAVAERGVEEDDVVRGCHSATFHSDKIITPTYAQDAMYCYF
jgi:hypothetical protein